MADLFFKHQKRIFAKDSQSREDKRLARIEKSTIKTRAAMHHPASISVGLMEPDIAGNTGAIMRLCAAFAVPLHLIGPYGFVLSDQKLKRAGMDYRDKLTLKEYQGWPDFRAKNPNNRLILLETDGDIALADFHFRHGDILLLGAESSGAPKNIYPEMNAVLRIPLAPGRRSLNVGMAAAISLYTALNFRPPL